MPQREPRVYLYDIAQAAELLMQFTEGQTLDDYQRDIKLRSAVERQFEIIGEALSQLARHFPEQAEQISDAPQIISFRNYLIHGYALVNDRLVWNVLTHDLPLLVEQVRALLEE